MSILRQVDLRADADFAAFVIEDRVAVNLLERDVLRLASLLVEALVAS